MRQIAIIKLKKLVLVRLDKGKEFEENIVKLLKKRGVRT